MTNNSVSRIIEIAEFLSHSSKECGAWFSVEGEVFPLTLVERSLFSLWGVPTGTKEFQAIHSETAKNMMPKYHVGTLSAAAKAALANTI